MIQQLEEEREACVADKSVNKEQHLQQPLDQVENYLNCDFPSVVMVFGVLH